MKIFVGYVLGKHRQEIDGIEDFKVAVDLGIQLRAINDNVGRRFEGDSLHGKGIAEDVLAELFAFGAVFWWHGPAGVNVEAGMFPGLHAGNQFWGDEFVGEQFPENSVTIDLLHFGDTGEYLRSQRVCCRYFENPRNFLRIKFGDPNGIRTRVTAVKGRCPRPLDDRVASCVSLGPGPLMSREIRGGLAGI